MKANTIISSTTVEVPDRYRGVCGNGNNLFFVWAPLDLGYWTRVSETFGKHTKLIQSLDGVDKDFVCFSAVCQESSRGTHANR